MDSADPLIWIALFVLAAAVFVLEAFCTACENVQNSELEEEEGLKGKAAAKILALKEDPEKIRYSLWFWEILAAVLSAVLITGLFRGTVRTAAAAAVLAALFYILCRVLPDLLARRWEKAFAVRLLPFAAFLLALSSPFTAALNLAAFLLARIFGVNAASLEDAVTEDEILSMVNEGHEQGVLDEDEAEMIQNIFEFDDKQAQDIMTHRSQITAIEGSTRLDDAIRFMADAPNSRFPVYEGNIDNITGALYLKDAMRFHMQETYNIWYIKDIPDLLREVKFIPETRRIDDLFRSMQKTQVQMAIVVDEYGETSGLVTMEDILEEIVGNIFDEYDRQEKMIIPAWEGSWKLNGMLSPEEAGEALGTVFPEDFDTLSGYLTAKLNHIPGEEDRSAVIEDPDTGYRFRILSLEGSMIQWAQAERLSPREEEG